MVILKHGIMKELEDVGLLFKCQNCYCIWDANRSEADAKTEYNFEHGYANTYHEMDCPECGLATRGILRASKAGLKLIKESNDEQTGD